MSDSPGIKRLIDGAPIGVIKTIDLIGQGYASVAYKVVSTEGEFIALTQRKDCIEPSDYAYHFVILKALKAINYKFAPQAVYVNPEQTAIVITLIPGKPISWIYSASEAEQKQTADLLLEALIDLRRLEFEPCATEYKKLTGQTLKTVTLQSNIKHYMTDWFDIAQAGRPDPELTAWLKPKVRLCESFAQNSTPGQQKIFAHGDTSEINILLTSDLKLGLIDWDSSCFVQYPRGWDDFGIGYLMNHVPLFQKYRPQIIEAVSQRCNISARELEKATNRQQENIKLGDIMWAYMMHARSLGGEIKDDPAKFMTIARQRIKDYQKQFTNDSFLPANP